MLDHYQAKNEPEKTVLEFLSVSNKKCLFWVKTTAFLLIARCGLDKARAYINDA